MSDPNLEARERRHSNASTSFFGLAIAAGVLAFFAQPSLQSFDPKLLGALGALVAFTIVWLYHFFVVSPTSRWVRRVAYALLAITFCFYVLTLVENYIRGERMEDLCEVIERELMAPEPRRDDLADVFQAMRCQPTGAVPLQLPPAKQ